MEGERGEGEGLSCRVRREWRAREGEKGSDWVNECHMK